MSDEIVPGDEPHPRKFVGSVVRFDLRRTGGKTTEEKGEITEQRWLGFTKRADSGIRVTILGKTGRSVRARVTRDHVVPL
jgi:hypothetical protein